MELWCSGLTCSPVKAEIAGSLRHAALQLLAGGVIAGGVGERRLPSAKPDRGCNRDRAEQKEGQEASLPHGCGDRLARRYEIFELPGRRYDGRNDAQE